MPLPSNTVTEIGDCKLVLGKCCSYISKIDWHSIDLLLTDPPYGIDYKSNWLEQEGGKTTRNGKIVEGFEKIENDYSLDALSEMLTKVSGKLKGNAGVYCFCSPKNVDEVLPLMRKFFKVKNLLVWDKDNWSAGDLKSSYGFQYEQIVYAVKNKGRELNWRIGDILQYPRVNPNDLIHPNQKPDQLLTKLILNSTNEGDLVFDPFTGSGRVGVCCARLNRRFIGCELDSLYYQKAVVGIQQAYGILNHSARKSPSLDELGEASSEE